MTKISLYLESDKNMIKEFTLDSKPKNIEDARFLLIENLGDFYSGVKYEVKLSIPWESNDSKIDVIFDRSNELKRDFLINKILNND
jgi:hypothetical protein